MKKIFKISLALMIFASIIVLTNKKQVVHGEPSWVCPDHGAAYTKMSKTEIDCMTPTTYYFYCTYNEAGIGCYQTYEESLGVGPHSYVVIESSRVAATCTTDGGYTRECDLCGEKSSVKTNRLGHNFVSNDKLEPTCTEDGYNKESCTRCSESKNTVLEKLGHDLTTEIEEATCTSEGKKTEFCSRCDYKNEEILPLLEHELEVLERVEPTCEEAGHELTKCSLCEEEFETVIDPLGHSYPEEWTIIKEAGLFVSGEKKKTCLECTSTIFAKIDPTVSFAVVAGVTSAVIGVVGVALYAFRKKRVTRKIAKVSELKEFEDKILVLNLVNEDENPIETFFKKKAYLSVNVASDEELSKAISDNEADLTIFELTEDRGVDEIVTLIETCNAENEDASYAVYVNCFADNELITKLEALKEEETIVNYVLKNNDETHVLKTLILPLYKPEFTVDGGIEKLGDLCDLIGIPFVSTATNLYLTGKDIKENLESDEKGYDEISTIIADVASILGIEEVESVKDFIDSTIAVKDALAKDHGANETKEGIKAAVDIVETLEDIIK